MTGPTRSHRYPLAVVDDTADTSTLRHADDDVAPFRHSTLVAIFAAIALMIVANNVGAVNLANWVEERPMLLLAFNSTNKMLLTVAGRVAEWAFVLIPMARLLAPDPLFYALGNRYRGHAVRWGSDLYPGARSWMKELTDGSAGSHAALQAAVFVMPNNPVCLAAGIARMPVATFWALNIAGTLARIALFRVIAMVFADQIDAVVDAIVTYQSWFTRIALAVLAVVTVMQLRRLAGAADDLEEA